jgi:predicted nucleotidyltransferase
MIIPDMGTKSGRSRGLADALFSPVQQRVLGLLYGQPQRRFQSAELIRLAGSGTGAAHRLLTRLADAGIVTVTRSGNQKHYQANRHSPIFTELHRLVIKTVGIVGPLRRALAPFAKRIAAAFVYGSVSKRADTTRSDIDVMVISDSVTYPDLFRALQDAERVARPVNPNVMTKAEWRANEQNGPSLPASLSNLGSSSSARTMTSPELENLVRLGHLKPEACSQRDFDNLVKSGSARSRMPPTPRFH